MSDVAISPIRALGRATASGVSCLFSVGSGSFGGVGEGRRAAAGIIKDTALGIDEAMKIGKIVGANYSACKTYADYVDEFFRGIFRKFIGYGSAGIEKSGFSKLLTSLWSGVSKNGIKALGPSLAKAGAPGLALLGIGAFLCTVGLLWGTRLGTTSYGKFSEIKKGYQADIVNKGWLWGAMSASGFGMAIGCALAVATGGAVGVGLAVAGLVCAVGGRLLRYGMGGHHMINIPQRGIFPLNILARTFNNTDFVR